MPRAHVGYLPHYSSLNKFFLEVNKCVEKVPAEFRELVRIEALECGDGGPEMEVHYERPHTEAELAAQRARQILSKKQGLANAQRRVAELLNDPDLKE